VKTHIPILSGLVEEEEEEDTRVGDVGDGKKEDDRRRDKHFPSSFLPLT